MGVSRIEVVGASPAPGSTDDATAKPLKIATVYRATKPTYADGQVVEPQVTSRGALDVSLWDDGTAGFVSVLQTLTDTITNAVRALSVMSHGLLYNGSTWERKRGPVIFKNLNAAVVTSETTIWTPAAGKKFRLMGWFLDQGVATGTVLLKDNTGGSTILVIPPESIGVQGPVVMLGNGILSAAANNVLTATGVSTETLTGFVFGTEE